MVGPEVSATKAAATNRALPSRMPALRIILILQLSLDCPDCSVVSVDRPQRQRRRVLDEDAIARDHRLRPGGAGSHCESTQRLESAHLPARHNQLAVVFECKPELAGADDCGVGALTRFAGPQRLAASRIEREELAAAPL